MPNLIDGNGITAPILAFYNLSGNRNPQKFVANIFQARDSDYVAATQRIFRSSRYPSHVAVPVLTH